MNNQWIPCSERLPEEDGEYLVTIADYGWWDDDVGDLVDTDELKSLATYSGYFQRFKKPGKYGKKWFLSWQGYDDVGESSIHEVHTRYGIRWLAWMPLPEPYAERRER